MSTDTMGTTTQAHLAAVERLYAADGKITFFRGSEDSEQSAAAFAG